MVSENWSISISARTWFPLGALSECRRFQPLETSQTTTDTTTRTTPYTTLKSAQFADIRRLLNPQTPCNAPRPQRGVFFISWRAKNKELQRQLHHHRRRLRARREHGHAFIEQGAIAKNRGA